MSPHAIGKKKGESESDYATRVKRVHASAPAINALEGVSREMSLGIVKRPYIGRTGKGGGVNVTGSAAEPTGPDAAAAGARKYGVEVKAKRRARRQKVAAVRSGY